MCLFGLCQVMVLDEFTPNTAWDWQAESSSVSDESKGGEADGAASCRLRMYAEVLRQAKQQFQFHETLTAEQAQAAIRAATSDAQVRAVPTPRSARRGLARNHLLCTACELPGGCWRLASPRPPFVLCRPE